MEGLQKDALSPEAKRRLHWMEHYEKYRNARLTCRHFGISPDTFYLWKNRFDRKNPATLEDNTSNRRPKKLRTIGWNTHLLARVKHLYEVNPKLGKYRLTKLLSEQGFTISSSTVGRILHHIRGKL